MKTTSRAFALEPVLWNTFLFFFKLCFGLWLVNWSYQVSHYRHKITSLPLGTVILAINTNVVSNNVNGCKKNIKIHCSWSTIRKLTIDDICFMIEFFFIIKIWWIHALIIVCHNINDGLMIKILSIKYMLRSNNRNVLYQWIYEKKLILNEFDLILNYYFILKNCFNWEHNFKIIKHM